MHIHADRLRPIVRLPKTTDTYRESAGGVLGPKDLEAILEIACFAVAIDREIRDEELAALDVISGELHALAGKPKAVSASRLVARLAPPQDREAQSTRLHEIGASMASPAVKQLAYKIATALRHVDLAEADEEFELGLDLLEALGIDDATSDALMTEVMDVLNGPET